MRRTNPAAREREKGPDKEAIFKYKTCMQNTIADVLRNRPGFRLTEADDFDFIWADKEWIRENFNHIHFDEGVRVNHFRNFFELTRKDLMVKNLKRARKQLERDGNLVEAAKYDFCPSTHVLPMDYQIFKEDFKRQPQRTLWIAKPIGSSQGKGIFLFTHLKEVSAWKKDIRFAKQEDKATPEHEVQTYVVSKYIENPFLVGGKKFDLRLYVLVTSYSPMTVWMYRNGFARFSKWRYSMKTDDIGNAHVHLTNVAVQKTAPGYDKDTGCKWQLHCFKRYLMAKFGREAANDVMCAMQMLVVRSLLAVQKVIMNDRHCFELYGYDVLVDDNLKPWLLEVNASPSLTADTSADYELKVSMLNDLLDVVDIEGKRNGSETTVGGFDLIYVNGVASVDKTGTTNLGCNIDRNKSRRARGAASRAPAVK